MAMAVNIKGILLFWFVIVPLVALTVVTSLALLGMWLLGVI